MNLAGKKAIVTGGVRGLGRAIAESFHAKGVSVTVLDRDSAGLDSLSAERVGIDGLACDVSSEEQVADALASYHARHRAADILVNNAGILHSEPLVRLGANGLERHGMEGWNKVIGSNLTSVFLVSSFVVERMIATRTKGVIVNISSVAGTGNAGQSAYSASKAGVNALAATWAKELGPWGIRAVAVAPGFTDTESTRRAVAENILKETLARVPMRRLGQPAEIAHAVIAVVENDFMNGKVIAVDGGLVI